MSLALARPHLDVLLVTADLAAAVEFWTEVLDLTIEHASEREARLALGPQRIHIVAPDPAPPRQPGAMYAGTGLRVIGLIVDDLDDVCERIRARGRKVAEAQGLPGQWPIRFARDADGNMLELIGRPGAATLGARDRLQVGLTVPDSRPERQFWGERLGFAEQPAAALGDGTMRHAFDVGRSTLKFWSRPETLPCLAGPPGRAVGIRAVTLAVDSLAAARDATAHHGLRPVGDPGIPGVADTFWLEDPAGAWVGLTEE